MHGSIDPRTLLRNELAQRTESGFDTTSVCESIAKHGGFDAIDIDRASDLCDQLDVSARIEGWSYVEPDDLITIRAECRWPEEPQPPDLDESYVQSVYRAWTGRVVGNMLGKPVEGWTRESIRELLERRGAWPLDDYFPAPDNEDLRAQYVPCWTETTQGNIDGSSRDDDVDYTILNLHILRSFGLEFTTGQVAASWLELLPYLQTYTAERVAIRNLIHGRLPAEAAVWHNPYREFIGAAIRADVFGYVSPGNCGRAAELAYRDAYLSHRGNGIYSAMWCAALVAASFTAADALEAIDQSLSVVPTRSRLYKAISDVRSWHREGASWELARDRIRDAWPDYSWVHAINNAAVLAAGVLYGGSDFSRTIGLTVAGGLDTDSNGGTAGSVGALLATDIPERWTLPLRDLVRSAVFGYDNASLLSLAESTVEVATAFSAEGGTAVAARDAIPPELW